MICKEIKELIDNNLDRILMLRSEKMLKEDDSYVSKGDLFCESLIKNHLSIYYPSYFLVSEESPDENQVNWVKENVVVLDPIDGTENFVSGLKEWGVAVSIYRNGAHVESMLALPELGIYLFSGDKISKYSSRIMGISSSLTKEDILALESGFEYRIIGCAVYNLYNVIVGSFFSFENPKGAKVWDILPGLNLALEHGLSVTVNNNKYYGELLDPSKKYIFKIQNK